MSPHSTRLRPRLLYRQRPILCSPSPRSRRSRQRRLRSSPRRRPSLWFRPPSWALLHPPHPRRPSFYPRAPKPSRLDPAPTPRRAATSRPRARDRLRTTLRCRSRTAQARAILRPARATGRGGHGGSGGVRCRTSGRSRNAGAIDGRRRRIEIAHARHPDR